MDSLSGTKEAPGKQERTNWTACKYQGGTREAGKDQLDSLRGTREAGKDHLDSLGGTREAPGAVKGNPALRGRWRALQRGFRVFTF